MKRYLLIALTTLALSSATLVTAGTNQPTTAPSQIKKCCVDDKNHYHPEWARGINCPHNHKYCK